MLFKSIANSIIIKSLILIWWVYILVLTLMGCKSDADHSDPELYKTLKVQYIGFTRVHVCVKVDTSVNDNFFVKGVCYSTENNPTIADSTSQFYYWSSFPTMLDFVVTGLKPNTTYYLRPYTMDADLKTSYYGMAVVKTKALDTASVCFQFNRESGSWGITHNGWFMDSKGNVMGYNCDATDSYNNPNFKPTDDEGFITKDDLDYNLRLTDTIYQTINLPLLSSKIGLITNASSGTFINSSSGCWDCPDLYLYGYLWDKTRNKYKRILLEHKGYQNSVNNNTDAILLADWLKTIGNSVCNCQLFN